MNPEALFRSMFEAAVAAARPENVIAAHLPETPKGRTVVVGAGKGSAQMAQAFERLANDLDRIVKDSGTPIRDFTSSGLYELSQFVSEARTLVASLTRLAYQLERDPARFLFGDQQKGFQAR